MWEALSSGAFIRCDKPFHSSACSCPASQKSLSPAASPTSYLPKTWFASTTAVTHGCARVRDQSRRVHQGSSERYVTTGRPRDGIISPILIQELDGYPRRTSVQSGHTERGFSPKRYRVGYPSQMYTYCNRPGLLTTLHVRFLVQPGNMS